MVRQLSLSDFKCDPFLVFRALRAGEEDVFFFETSQSLEFSPAISIIGLGPFDVISDRGGEIQASRSDGSQRILKKSFLQVLRDEVADLQRLTSDSSGQFHAGGLFGCIGYELVSDFEPRLNTSPSFAKAIHDRTLRAEVLLARRLIVFDHHASTVTLIDVTSQNEGKMVLALDSLEQRLRLIANQVGACDHLRKHAPSLSSERTYLPTMGREKYIENVRKLRGHIRAGDIFQAVLAEKFTTQVGVSALDVLTALRERSPSPYSYFFKFSDRELIGASPEALVRTLRRRRTVQTFPIAGTRPRGETPAEDARQLKNLLRSEKEEAEHLMLVDLARNDIGRVATAGSVKVNAYRSVLKLSHVMHLVSEVEGELGAERDALDALVACFPAGTLSGAPKIRAMEILSELEQEPRGLYGGAVMALDPNGDLDACIAIRSLEIFDGGNAVLRAGAGIVADSRPEAEYEEVCNKLKLLREAIALAEQP